MGKTREVRTPVSLVCVFNEPDVLASCLRRSIDVQRASAPETELIAVDNRDGRFSTAGAALNHGARSASNPVVVFVHQDVVVHSLPALERAAAALLADTGIGILGAVGIDSDGRIVGRVRDRVVQIGAPSPHPAPVDSLDEVLLMVSRERVLRSPLSEDPLLAWHAYGVEYACRVRHEGLTAAATDVQITHNSLTTNLARLAEAHQRVGDEYPALLPIRTTCGTIARESDSSRISRLLGRRAGAATWWHESGVASRLARQGVGIVLADIRLAVDDAVARGGMSRLTVIDASRPGTIGAVSDLVRFGVPFGVEQADGIDELRSRLSELRAGEALLFVGLDESELAALSRLPHPHVGGYWYDTGLWLLSGIDARVLRPLWNARRNRPYAGLLPQRVGASS